MKKIIILILLLISVSTLVNAANIFDFNFETDSTISAWYPVPEKFKIMCKYYGGEETPEQVVLGDDTYVSDVTATLNVRKHTLADQSYLYEVGYYVEAFQNSIDFKISLSNSQTVDYSDNIWDPATVQRFSSKSDFTIYYDTQNYNQAEFKYKQGGLGWRRFLVNITDSTQ
ncbi:hypothetical protein ACFLZX_01450 [Nanoarchaeota archaeon]